MNFETLQKGIYSLVMSVSVTLSSTLLPPAPSSPSQNPLQDPGVIQSFNVHSESKTVDNYNIELPQIKEIETETAPTIPEAETKILGTQHKIQASAIFEESTKSAVVTVELPVKPQKKIDSTEDEEKPSPKASPVKTETKEKTKETPTPVTQKLAANAEKLFEMANEYRKNLNLAPFEKEERVCKIAEARATQVNDEVFNEGPLHKGFKALNLPYWATENIAAYSSIEQNFKFWTTHSIHKQAIEGQAKYSCIACAGTACSQIFTSFLPK